FYTSLKEMLRKEPRLQAVSICTPSGLHYRGALEAARAGRHVLSEKPLDITLDHMDRMIEGCDKAGVKLGCIFQKRTTVSSLLAKKALQKKMLGKLLLGDCSQKYYRSPAYYRTADWRGTWKLDGGGALMNQAVHGIDLLLWLMGDVESVFTYSGTLVRKIEVEDTSISVVRFKSGAFGNIIGTTSVVPGQGCRTEIHGERGTIKLLEDGELFCRIGKEVKGVHKHEEVDLHKVLGGKKVAVKTKKGPTVASDNTALELGGHAKQVQDFCEAIKRNRNPMITGPDARRAVELILAIYKSWKTRKEVKLPLK
ncbi:MAG: Gfo/Idh/MocA family oxidoreductase, partial [Lentisphaerae bacterium]|nr:Gfo/Idh/MocA family oxidoreductase [Lentisphaerota bacterium]